MRFRISQLNIYPIKSCGGISVTEAEIVQRGFRYDRRWMITDKDGMFLTQRSHPRLALATMILAKNRIQLRAKGLEEIYLPADLHEGSPIAVEVWGSRVNALRAERNVEEWFSDLLDQRCCVVYMPEDSIRPLNPKYSRTNEHIAFSDAFPFLLLSEASLTDLNARLREPVPMNRFRPNIVVADCTAYEEDTWREIRIGTIPFRVAKPCARCATITVDQEAGVKTDEPLRTLATYRSADGEVMFGQNLVHQGLGFVRAGDPLKVVL